jgi:high-affinity nickel-transport protein
MLFETTQLAAGFGLGVVHAAEADHLLALGALVDGRRGRAGVVGEAARWGLGHGLAICAVGFLALLADVPIPANFATLAEWSLVAMLLGLGVHRFLRPPSDAPPRRRSLGALVVGVVHGLGGSAALALLAAATVHPATRACAWLGLFCLGTVAGMSLIALAMTGLFGHGDRRIAWTWLHRACAAGSVVLGLFLLHDLLAHPA